MTYVGVSMERGCAADCAECGVVNRTPDYSGGQCHGHLRSQHGEESATSAEPPACVSRHRRPPRRNHSHAPRHSPRNLK